MNEEEKKIALETMKKLNLNEQVILDRCASAFSDKLNYILQQYIDKDDRNGNEINLVSDYLWRKAFK